MILTSLSRFQAFSIHLLISFIIFLVVAFFITQVWYPDILFDLSGGFKAILLIIGVDLILGPLLTLLVFNPQKKAAKELKMDMGLIAIVQVLALSWGVHSISNNHPIAVFFMGNQFSVIYSAEPKSVEIQNKVAEKGSYVFYYEPKNIFSADIQMEDVHAYHERGQKIVLDYLRQVATANEEAFYSVATNMEGMKIRVSADDGSIIKVDRTVDQTN